jgi:hypothetical protein
MKIYAYINDEAEEYLMNLTAQGYYGEAWEFIIKLTDAFNKSLYLIAGRALLGDILGDKNDI